MEDLLYADMINTAYKYYEYIKPIWTQQFLNETRDYVWDLDHPWYNLYISTADNESIQTDNIKKLYKKLALKYHPDKCHNPLIFPRIHQLYMQGDIQKLEHIDQCNHPDEVIKYIDHMNGELTKEQQIEKWKMEIWYQWKNPNSIFRLLFITKDELSRRMEERHYKIQLLQQDIQDKQREIQELKFKLSKFNVS